MSGGVKETPVTSSSLSKPGPSGYVTPPTNPLSLEAILETIKETVAAQVATALPPPSTDARRCDYQQ